jgi:Secretion system C-terminal sorting domain/Pregnancy-associated plasma protein-A
MLKKIFLAFLVLIGISNVSLAQSPMCGTDEKYLEFQQKHPEVLVIAAQLEEYIKAHTKQSIDPDHRTAAKTTGIYESDTAHLAIPVVVHVIHDYGAEFIPDNNIYKMIDDMNKSWNLLKPSDTQYLYPEFKKYIGKFRMKFYLATKDPSGNPTKGITRRRSYLTVGGDNEAKFDTWAPYSYVNIWIEKQIGATTVGGTILAYATPPASAAVSPYSDGIIANYAFINDGKTIAHEMGHIFNLSHTWGSSNNPCTKVNGIAVCGDDAVDDTPPTVGHFGGTTCGSCPRADTTCLALANTSVTNKSIIDTNTKIVVDSLNGVGIDIVVYSHSALSTVSFYPAPSSLAKPYGVALLHYNGFLHRYDTLQKVNGIVSSVSTTTPQTVTFNYVFPRSFSGYTISIIGGVPVSQPYTIPTDDSGYRVIFFNNPGTRRDTASSSYSTKIAGAISVKNDISTTPHASGMYYNYFYQPKFNYGYFKIYSNVNGADSLADYPDTTNVQNYMDYSDCSQGINFTIGQVNRSRAAARSTVGNRNNLSDTANLIFTGILRASDSTLITSNDSIPPTPEFSVEKGFLSVDGQRKYYGCIGNKDSFVFKNQSWNDTVTSVKWTFSNNPVIDSSNIMGTVRNIFRTSGWVTLSLTARSNENRPGVTPLSNTMTDNRAVYVADTTSIQPLGYFQEFNPTPIDPSYDREKFPIFNYYNNQFKWEYYQGAGFYDNTCIRYTTYDNRVYPGILTGMPAGDYDDFFTPAFDLSGLVNSNCNLNFMYAGAWRTSYSAIMLDKLDIAYSINCGASWVSMKTLTKANIGNNGQVTTPFVPSSSNDWALQSINIPTAARTNRTFFRFRYSPGVDTSTSTNGNAFNPNEGTGTGNNFYIDRINISNNPLGLNTLITNNKPYTVAPNPTNGNAYIYMQNPNGDNIQIMVTDITGKAVFTTQFSEVSNNVKQIEIPASALTVKGMYLIHITNGTNSYAEKLIAY